MDCDAASRARHAKHHVTYVCIELTGSLITSGSMRSWVPASPLHRSISGGWPHCSVHCRADALVVFPYAIAALLPDLRITSERDGVIASLCIASSVRHGAPRVGG